MLYKTFFLEYKMYKEKKIILRERNQNIVKLNS
jgi:hypothetical protein